MDAEGIHIEHAIPGRIRLKVAQLKNNPEYAKVVTDLLEEVARPKRVKINLTIGSLLVEYDPKLPLIIDQFAQLLDVLLPNQPEIKSRFKEYFSRLHETGPGNGRAHLGRPAATPELAARDRGVRTATRGAADLRVLLPLTLLALGLGSLLLADPITFPAWYEYLWFGFATALTFYSISQARARA